MTVREYKIDEYFGPPKSWPSPNLKTPPALARGGWEITYRMYWQSNLAKTGRFILLDRENVDKILEQLSFSQAGLSEGELEQIQLIDADFL